MAVIGDDDGRVTCGDTAIESRLHTLAGLTIYTGPS